MTDLPWLNDPASVDTGQVPVLAAEADEYRRCPECDHRWSEHGEGRCVEGCDCVIQPLREWARPVARCPRPNCFAPDTACVLGYGGPGRPCAHFTPSVAGTGSGREWT